MGKGREQGEMEGEVDTGRCPEGGHGEREGEIYTGRCGEGERTWGERERRHRYCQM